MFIDDESPRFSSEGTPLFEDSEPTEFLQKIIEAMSQLSAFAQNTQLIVDALQRFEVIVPWDAALKLENDAEALVPGLYRVDEDVLNKLNIEEWIELREMNAFPLIYGQLLSTRNLDKLVIYQNMKSEASRGEDLGINLDVGDDESLNFDLL
jgi:hypothetical protein